MHSLALLASPHTPFASTRYVVSHGLKHLAFRGGIATCARALDIARRADARTCIFEMKRQGNCIQSLRSDSVVERKSNNKQGKTMLHQLRLFVLGMFSFLFSFVAVFVSLSLSVFSHNRCERTISKVYITEKRERNL